MEKKPITDYPQPGYPSLAEVDDLNALIYSSLPCKWTSLSLKYSALALMLASFGNTSALTVDKIYDDGSYNRPLITHKLDKTKIPKKQINESSVIAPIFNHGEGRGSDGCIVSSPPIFISEADASIIIKAEFSKAGIKFDVNNVIIPLPEPVTIDKTVIDSLRFDTYSSDYNLLVNFVNEREDLLVFGSELSSVREIRTKGAANNLAQTLAQTKGLKIAQFYDPLERENWWGKPEEREASYNKAKEQLALQVRDFLAWASNNNFLTPVNPPKKNTSQPQIYKP